MEPEFQITHDEKELLIECIVTDLYVRLKAMEDHPDDNPMYKEWYKHREEHLKSLIVRIREEL